MVTSLLISCLVVIGLKPEFFLIKIKKIKFGREKLLVKFIYFNNHRQSVCSCLHPKSWHSNKMQTAMFFIIHFLFQG